MRLAGRFSRRVQSYAEAHQIPFIRSRSEERKHLVAQPYLPQDPKFTGLFLVLVNGCHPAVTSCPQGAIGPVTTGGLVPGLTQFAETLCSSNIVGQLRQVCEHWLYSTCLHFVLPEEAHQRSGFHYDYSLYQAEYSHNLLFHHGREMEQVFATLIDRTRTRLDIKR